MAVFEWQGLSASGKKLKGVRNADSAKALRGVLRKEGVMVTDVIESNEAASKASRDIDFGRYFRRVTATDIALGTRQLATLLRSGIPLVEALSALADQTEKEDLRRALTQTRDKVNEGISLADALRAHPKIFNPLYVNMVAAGEASGTIETVLGRLADFLEDQARLKSKVGSALAYPAFMAVMGLGIIAIMMVVVVPKVTSIFEDFKQALPWYTRALIFTSNVFSNYWWLLILLLAGSITAFRRWKRSEKGKKKWDLWVLSAPIFGKLLLMIDTSRFARTLSTLLAGGVPLLNALEITRNVLGNSELMRVVDEARASIREGESIAAPLKKSGRFPPIMTHMISVGEKSGQLEEMLANVALAFDAQVENRITAMTSLLEPLMIVMMGGVSGTIAFAILMPLLRINEFVQ
jgi:general secretion pathway protein F